MTPRRYGLQMKLYNDTTRSTSTKTISGLNLINDNATPPGSYTVEEYRKNQVATLAQKLAAMSTDRLTNVTLIRYEEVDF